MAITGNAFDVNTQGQKVFQIFFDFLIPFTIRQTVELRKLYRVITVQDQAKVIVEICSIDQQVHSLRRINSKNRWPQKIVVEEVFQTSFRVTTFTTNLCDGMAFYNPFFKPDESIASGYSRILPDKQKSTGFALIALLKVLNPPFYTVRTSAAPTSLFLRFPMNKKRELKRISIPLDQTLAAIGLQPFLPTIFCY